jgi:hypothetical protein
MTFLIGENEANTLKHPTTSHLILFFGLDDHIVYRNIKERQWDKDLWFCECTQANTDTTRSESYATSLLKFNNLFSCWCVGMVITTTFGVFFQWRIHTKREHSRLCQWVQVKEKDAQPNKWKSTNNWCIKLVIISFGYYSIIPRHRLFAISHKQSNYRRHEGRYKLWTMNYFSNRRLL